MGLLNRAGRAISAMSRGSRHGQQDASDVLFMSGLSGAGMGGSVGGLYGLATGQDPGQTAMAGAAIGGLGLPAMVGGGGLRSAMRSTGEFSKAAEFMAKKEALATQLERQSPQAAQLIRQARDEMDLEDIIGRLQNPASFGQGAGVGGSTVTQQGAGYNMRPPQDSWGR